MTRQDRDPAIGQRDDAGCSENEREQERRDRNRGPGVEQTQSAAGIRLLLGEGVVAERGKEDADRH